MSLQQFSDDVTLELTEMKKIGMRVPKKAFALAKDLKVMAEYEDMNTTECSDLLISIADIS